MVIAGRVADVDLALGHDDVRALAAQKAAERGGSQSQRLALAKEGQITEGSPAWEDMSAGDRAKRKRAAGALGSGGCCGHMAGHGAAGGCRPARLLPLLADVLPVCALRLGLGSAHPTCFASISAVIHAVPPLRRHQHTHCSPPLHPPPAPPAEEKKLKLRSPNFVVSDTRLSVRNIPASWTEKQLKAAFIQAVRGLVQCCLGRHCRVVFWRCLRSAVLEHAMAGRQVVHLCRAPQQSQPAIAHPAVPHQPTCRPGPCPQVKQRASKAQPVVKQVKILVDEERTAADGTPRSKGIGFVEFTEHEHALCALRQLNNNPTTFSKVGWEEGSVMGDVPRGSRRH